MSDRRGHLGIARRDGEDVAAGDGEPPNCELVRLHTGQGGRKAYGGSPVVELFGNAYQLPWCAATLAEVAVVECQHAVSGSMKPFGEPVGAGFFGHAYSGGHDHGPAVVAWVMPSCAVTISAREDYFAALAGFRHGAFLTSVGLWR